MADDMQSKLKHLWGATLAFLHETGIGHEDDAKRPLLLRFAHFWLLVGKSFVRNRCPVRASALAYTTLLALIPLLAVGFSIATSIVQSKGGQPVQDMTRALVRNVAPMLDLEVKTGTSAGESNLDKVVNNIDEFIKKVNTGTVGLTGSIALVFVAIGLLRTIEATFNDIWGITKGRGWVASIIQYWATITLGPVVLLLVLGLQTGPHFAKTKRILGLSLLTGGDIKTPEAFMGQLLDASPDRNPVAAYLREKLEEKEDAGFRRAKRQFEKSKDDPEKLDPKALRKTLAESLNVLLEGQAFYSTNLFATVPLSAETQILIASRPKGHELDMLNRRLLDEAFPDVFQPKSLEWLSATGFYLLPFVLLSLAFGAFYMLMPNTKVQHSAALVGGIVGGTLWQLNNKLSVLYVSKVASYSQIYSGLAVIPLFLIGMYFSWLILLFGAQVAYAYQNRQSYLQEKQAEGVNQRGREFVALRIMTVIAQHFRREKSPPGINQIASTLGVPTQLVTQLIQPLMQAKLVVEVAEPENLYSPARPLNQITAHDVLMALRAGQGTELETKDDSVRSRVRSGFDSICDAERETAASVTLESLAAKVDLDDTPREQKPKET